MGKIMAGVDLTHGAFCVCVGGMVVARTMVSPILADALRDACTTRS
jgi:hypothetical protein